MSRAPGVAMRPALAVFCLTNRSFSSACSSLSRAINNLVHLVHMRQVISFDFLT